MFGLIRLTLFQTEYGISSGPGAEEGEDLARARAISSRRRGTTLGCLKSLPRGGGGGLGGKKGSSQAFVVDTGSSAPGMGGKRGVFLGVTNCLAVHMLCGVVLARKSAQ